jgi:hypothetical protein
LETNFWDYKEKKWNIGPWFRALLDMALVEETTSDDDCWTSKVTQLYGERPAHSFQNN